MSKEVFENLTLVASILLFLPLTISILKFKTLGVAQKKLAFLIWVTVIVEVISWMLWHQNINNLPMYHFYTVIQFLLIINIYKEELSILFPKAFFIVLGVVFTIFAITNTLFFQDLNTFNSNATTGLGLLTIFLALSYFYALLKEVKYSALENNAMFWISSGFLIYFSSNLILFFINNSIFKEPNKVSYLVWGLHAIVNIVLTIFYTIALWVKLKRQ
ncbi:hypothetical protein U6A24_20700 [Aquimarina gracilis]|uniref:YhhN-like protein n=1 Tax=Aquimarina gracilis TaxID=874422 RepID=A0ABU6A1B5_9FLAO|nr:hypothetical protein [Aquimarina gracilis]MEB3347909.1 hypothetical protein [Aquimarina gracilis]